MQFLKILLLVLVVFGAALFTFNNAISVPINLWGGLVAEVNLPFLVFATFLIGLVPMWLYHRAVRWRLAQRLTAAERVIADLKPVPAPMGREPVPPPDADAEPVLAPGSALPSPSSATPTEPFTLTP